MEEKTTEQIHTGKTRSGFAYEVPHERVDNFELLDELVALRHDKTKITTVVRMLLGDEQFARLKEHCRSASGIVALTAIERELEDIFGAIGQAKN